jgi:hypothetical protein
LKLPEALWSKGGDRQDVPHEHASEDFLSSAWAAIISLLASCSLIFAVAKAPSMAAVKMALLTSANPDFTETLAGSRQTEIKEVGVSRETLCAAFHEGFVVCSQVSHCDAFGSSHRC